MKKYVNGDLVEMTAEEISAYRKEEAKMQIDEHSRPLTFEEVQTLALRQTVNTLSIDNQTAGRMTDYFPLMSEVCEAGALIPAKTRIRDDHDSSVLWRSNVDLWNNETNSPKNAPTLWDRIAYHDGIRIIPDEIPATLAWMNGELGWRDGHVYKSGMDGNVYLPGTQGVPWELMI